MTLRPKTFFVTQREGARPSRSHIFRDNCVARDSRWLQARLGSTHPIRREPVHGGHTFQPRQDSYGLNSSALLVLRPARACAASLRVTFIKLSSSGMFWRCKRVTLEPQGHPRLLLSVWLSARCPVARAREKQTRRDGEALRPAVPLFGVLAQKKAFVSLQSPARQRPCRSMRLGLQAGRNRA